MSSSEAGAKEEIIAVERRWVQAHRELDLAALQEIMADDYLKIQEDGTVVGKAAAIQSYRSGKRRWDHADSDEYQVRVHGDVAILVGRWIGRGENDGKRFDYAARFLSVYVRRAGVWQLAADQSTSISG